MMERQIKGGQKTIAYKQLGLSMDIETKVVQHVSSPKESNLTTLNFTHFLSTSSIRVVSSAMQGERVHAWPAWESLQSQYTSHMVSKPCWLRVIFTKNAAFLINLQIITRAGSLAALLFCHTVILAVSHYGLFAWRTVYLPVCLSVGLSFYLSDILLTFWTTFVSWEPAPWTL